MATSIWDNRSSNVAGDILNALLNCWWLVVCHSSHTRENCGESRTRSQSWDHFFFFLGTPSSQTSSALATASSVVMMAETCSISSSVVFSLELVEDDSLLELELAGRGVGDVVAAGRLVEGPGTGEEGGEAWCGACGGARVDTRGSGEGVRLRRRSGEADSDDELDEIRRSSVSGVVPSLTLFAGGKGVRAAAKTARRRGSSSSVSVPFPSLSSASLRDADAMSNLPVAGGDRVYHNHRVLEHVKLDQVLDEMRRRRRGWGRGTTGEERVMWISLRGWGFDEGLLATLTTD